jgi:POT family proton-dependent oligopeptide transporter
MADVQFYHQDEFGEERERLLKSDQEFKLDGIHDGLIFPTEDERLTLRRVPDSIPWNAYCKFPMNQFLTTES